VVDYYSTSILKNKNIPNLTSMNSNVSTSQSSISGFNKVGDILSTQIKLLPNFFVIKDRLYMYGGVNKDENIGGVSYLYYCKIDSNNIPSFNWIKEDVVFPILIPFYTSNIILANNIYMWVSDDVSMTKSFLLKLKIEGDGSIRDIEILSEYSFYKKSPNLVVIKDYLYIIGGLAVILKLGNQ
jgi:hypothetical protein